MPMDITMVHTKVWICDFRCELTVWSTERPTVNDLSLIHVFSVKLMSEITLKKNDYPHGKCLEFSFKKR